MFIVWPVSNITPNVAAKATGIPNATQNAVLEVKKTKRTIKTIINPLVALRVNRLILSEIKFATVPNCSTFKLCGKLFFCSIR